MCIYIIKIMYKVPSFQKAITSNIVNCILRNKCDFNICVTKLNHNTNVLKLFNDLLTAVNMFSIIIPFSVQITTKTVAILKSGTLSSYYFCSILA